MAKREVTVSIRVEGGKDGEAAVERMKRAFKSLQDASDKSISHISRSIQTNLADAFATGGEREYLETIRRLSPELKQLQENLRSGSFDIADYQRRMQLLDPATRSAIAAANQLGIAVRNTGDKAEQSTSDLGRLLIGLNLLDRAVDFVREKFRLAREEFLLFGKEMSAIATIVEDDFDLEKARQELASLPAALGKSSELAAGFKLAIGSGVEAGNALEFTAQSARAAKAGFAEIRETVDASTTVLNSYGIATGRVNEVYDLMFQTVKNGKIEFPELAQSIGQVSNVAAQSGVRLEEMFAVIATATATTKPSIAIEAFRSALSNILKPSEQAKELAESLGLEFNVASLRAKGFAGFLAEVIEKTKGNTDQLAILFGDVQGLNSILSITGAQAQNFAKNLKDMEGAAGNVDKAFQKQQSSLSAQAENFGVTFQKYVSGALSIVEPILTTILSLINKYPSVFVAAAVVVGALTAAHLLLNTQLVITASTAIPNLIRGIVNTIAIMTSFTSVTSMSATALTAFVTGWGLVAVAAVGLAAALYSYFSASNEVRNADEQRVNTLTKLIDVTNNDIKFLRDQTVSLTGSADARSRYNSILNSATLTEQATIKNLQNERSEREALSQILQKQNELRQEQIRTEAIAGAITASTKLQEALDAETQITSLMERRREYEDLIKQGFTTVDFGSGAIDLRNTISDLDGQIGTLSETNKEAIRILEQQVGVMANLAERSNQTGLEFLQFNGIVLDSETAQKRLAEKIDATIARLKAQREEALRAGKAMRDFAGDIQLVELAKSDVTITNEGVTSLSNQIKANLEVASQSGKDYAETLRQLKPQFNQLQTALQAGALDSKDYNERLNLIPETVRKALEESRKLGEYNPFEKTKKEASDAKKAVKDLRTELGDAASILDAMRTGTMMQESSGNVNVRDNLRTGAAGLFQVMPGNIPRWTDKWYSKTLSTAEFKKNVEAQIAVFNGQMGEYLQIAMKKANGDVKTAIRMAAMAWYGRGERDMFRYDDPTVFKQGEPSRREYTNQVLQRTMKAAGGGKSLQFAAFDAEAHTLQQIAEIRAHINQLISGGVDKNKQELEIVRAHESALEDIFRIGKELRTLGLDVTIELPDGPQKAKRTLESFNLLKSTYLNLRSQADSTQQRIFELSGELRGGVSELEKFDYQLQLNRQSGVLTAEDFAQLASEIERVRKALRLAASMDVSVQARGLTAGYAQQLEDIRGKETSKGTTDFLRSIEQVKNLRLEPGALTGIRELFLVGDRVDTEKFATHVRVWLNLLSAFGLFDKTKIEQVVAGLQAAADKFNEVSDARRNADFDSFNKSLQDEFEQVRRNERELSVYEETLRKIQTDYQHLDPLQKEQLLNTAAQIDAQKKLNEQYEELRDLFSETLHALAEGDFKGLVRGLADRAKDAFIDRISNVLASNILGFDPNATDNPVAKPIVGKIDESNKLLRQIAINTGGAPAATGMNLGSLFDGMLGNITGGPGPIFTGNQGGGIFNLTGAGGLKASGAGGTLNLADIQSFFKGSSGGGGFLDGIKNLFSTKEGGLFAARKNILTGKPSGLGGVLGGIGDIAAFAGGLIGGRFGNVLSMAGTGASIGAMFGPWGAAIGAGIGALIGLFGGDPKKKRDQKEKLPQLQQGFTDAFNQFRQLIEDVRFLRTDPDGALAKGNESRAQIASGFGIQFESKKYKKESQQLIASKTG